MKEYSIKKAILLVKLENSGFKLYFPKIGEKYFQLNTLQNNTKLDSQNKKLIKKVIKSNTEQEVEATDSLHRIVSLINNVCNIINQ